MYMPAFTCGHIPRAQTVMFFIDSVFVYSSKILRSLWYSGVDNKMLCMLFS